MTRKLSAMFLLSFVIVALLVTSVFGATERVKPFKERASFPARHAPVYGFPSDVHAASTDIIKSENSIALGGKTQSNPDTLGFTTYGYQHNCTMGRQVEHRGTGYIHFDWMWQDDNSITNTNRSVYYQAYDLTACPTAWTFATGGIDISTLGRAGYVSLDVDPNQNMAIPAGHESDGQIWGANTYYDFITSGIPFGLFAGEFPTDRYGYFENAGTGPGNETIWPKVDLQLGTETVLHMVTSESGGGGTEQTISYYRRVGGYGTATPTAVWSGQRVIDTTVGINQTVTAKMNGDKVAIVWVSPVAYVQNTSDEFNNQYENDVWYAVSTDQGAAWANSPSSGGSASIANQVEAGVYSGGNITQYNPIDDYKAYCDLSALITGDNNLHIVWGCRRWTDTTSLFRRSGAIFHWSEDQTSVRPVVVADWDTGGACYGHAWSTDVSKMSISECANDNLYVLFTQFGSAANPCGDIDSEKQVVNGYIYMTASDDRGVNWDRAQRVTNTMDTPTGCIPEDMSDSTIVGTCNSEYWASMARFSRTENCSGENNGLDVLDVTYINDKAPGGCVQTESGVWTVNPVIWWTTPCRDVIYEPLYSDDAGTGLGECFSSELLWVDPGGDTTIQLTISNPGLLVNNWTLAVVYTDGSGWLSAAPTSGALAPGGGSATINLTFTAPGGAGDPSTWVCDIEIDHDAFGGTTRVIPACLVVASSRIIPEAAVLATTCKRFKVYNNGELVNNESHAALDYIDDCDTFSSQTASEIYLYDASPVIIRLDGTDTLRYTAYSADFTDEFGLRPLSSLVVDSSTYAEYTYASGEFATADTAIGFIVEYFVPKASENCEFIIEKLKFFNKTASAINGVLVGEFLDWDVPSDSGSNNGSGFDVATNLIYQFGGEYDQDDSTEALCPQESDDRYAGISVIGGAQNAMTLDNATYVYTSGPYGQAAPIPPQAFYHLMNDEEGFSLYTTAVPESTYTDLSTLVTFGSYNLGLIDTFEVCKILATSKTGLDDLKAAIVAGEAFVALHELCVLTCCVEPGGDANGDGPTNVGDAVYLINYAFKGGPPPDCMSEGDANTDGSVNVGDAVYIINYAFKGGDTPLCGTID
ncbi:MAG: dockerin type I repeat-containing protein [candidate division Zixibacteria bacterium]|nr:dockerin type I repeat-containing protein [candidate division Zixibacteria bacterium]